jgi:hypothetical protein
MAIFFSKFDFFNNSNGHGCTWKSSTTSLYNLEIMNHQWINVRPLIHFMYGHRHVYPSVMNLVSIKFVVKGSKFPKVWALQKYEP